MIALETTSILQKSRSTFQTCGTNKLQPQVVCRALTTRLSSMAKPIGMFGDVEGFRVTVARKGLKATDWVKENCYLGKFNDTVKLCKNRMHIQSVAKRKKHHHNSQTNYFRRSTDEEANERYQAHHQGSWLTVP